MFYRIEVLRLARVSDNVLFWIFSNGTVYALSADGNKLLVGERGFYAEKNGWKYNIGMSTTIMITIITAAMNISNGQFIQSGRI
jgi:hypothetical protein